MAVQLTRHNQKEKTFGDVQADSKRDDDEEKSGLSLDAPCERVGANDGPGDRNHSESARVNCQAIARTAEARPESPPVRRFPG